MERLFPYSTHLQHHPIYHYAWIIVLFAAVVDVEPVPVAGMHFAGGD